jgi:hypothetical protein
MKWDTTTRMRAPKKMESEVQNPIEVNQRKSHFP